MKLTLLLISVVVLVGCASPGTTKVAQAKGWGPYVDGLYPTGAIREVYHIYNIPGGW